MFTQFVLMTGLVSVPSFRQVWIYLEDSYVQVSSLLALHVSALSVVMVSQSSSSLTKSASVSS